jgi:hypothetical protein
MLRPYDTTASVICIIANFHVKTARTAAVGMPQSVSKDHSASLLYDLRFLLLSPQRLFHSTLSDTKCVLNHPSAHQRAFTTHAELSCSC